MLYHEAYRTIPPFMKNTRVPLFVLTLLLANIHVINGQELASADVITDEPADEKPAANAELTALIEQGNKLLGKGDFITALPVWLNALKADKVDPNSILIGLYPINFRYGLLGFRRLLSRIIELGSFSRKNLDGIDISIFHFLLSIASVLPASALAISASVSTALAKYRD